MKYFGFLKIIKMATILILEYMSHNFEVFQMVKLCKENISIFENN
jgi:hypothetical protein